MMYELSVEFLVFIIAILVGLSFFIKNLAMPMQYYENREIFEDKIRERIATTPDYFGVVGEEDLANIVMEEDDLEKK